MKVKALSSEQDTSGAVVASTTSLTAESRDRSPLSRDSPLLRDRSPLSRDSPSSRNSPVSTPARTSQARRDSGNSELLSIRKNYAPNSSRSEPHIDRPPVLYKERGGSTLADQNSRSHLRNDRRRFEPRRTDLPTHHDIFNMNQPKRSNIDLFDTRQRKSNESAEAHHYCDVRVIKCLYCAVHCSLVRRRKLIKKTTFTDSL